MSATASPSTNGTRAHPLPADNLKTGKFDAASIHQSYLRGPAEAQDADNPHAGAVLELDRRIARETAWLDRQRWPAEVA